MSIKCKITQITNDQSIELLDKDTQLIRSLLEKIQRSILNSSAKDDGYLCIKDYELCQTINLLIENTEAIKILTNEGFELQALVIMRNSLEILLRVSVIVKHYKSVEFDQSKRDTIDISSKVNKENSKIFGNTKAFKFIEKMFSDKNNPFYNIAQNLMPVYEVLCSFSHPEMQLKSRMARIFEDYRINDDNHLEVEILLIGRKRKIYNNQDINNIFFNFECNALACRLTIELLRNIISDNDYDSNIQKSSDIMTEYKDVAVQFFRTNIIEDKINTSDLRH